MRTRLSFILLLLAMNILPGFAQQVWNFNLDWRFHRGEAKGAEAVNYDDSQWEVVSTPHTVQLMPAEGSGNRNYQGVAWYRKRFRMPATKYTNGTVSLQFEAIMGKQNIYVNGKLVKEHLGGYLPITIDLTAAGVKAGDECLIAVMTDNSDDKSYPPGKKQMTLDFCYHGGIYRDVWLIEQPAVHITDAVEKGEVAGGGIFVHYANISEKSAEVYVNTDVENSLNKPQTVTVTNTLLDAAGKKIKTWTSKVTIPAKGSKTIKQGAKIQKPNLWSPENPYLYTMRTQVLANKETEKRDTKIGIRSFEFKGKDGFWLNGKRYRQFMGANRHQDFAYVGNALPNSQQRRDVQRLKDCGFNLIRVAHYPQDPAFMDACDELGIFIIVATPGWQYWNKDPKFAELVHQNTRDIIRRDRNHPCVLMWEPILNETRYPEKFALEALQITKDEYPYPYRPVAAADLHSAGVLENYDVVYAWPGDDEKTDGLELKAQQLNKNMLTREYGELVDDWYAHNNLNRASRSWGEIPQLKQALSLSNTTRDQHRTTGLFLGGCQWHPFDHQRGYHPDPYWGGNFDAFRQPKTSYYMFNSQIPVTEGEPMVYIAHEMGQFSENDVVVFSNCDSVRLSIFDGEKSWTLPVEKYGEADRPYNAPVVFKDVWDFWQAREYSYKQRNWQKVNLVAEGIINGKVVATTKRMPSRRSTKLRMYADERDRKLVADGSDFIVVVCEVTDDSGNVRRLAKEQIKFTVEGPAEIIGDGTDIGANPRQAEWGSAPILLRSTTTPGKIKIHADVLYPGTHSPTPCDLEVESVPADCQFVRGLGIDASSKAKVSGSASSSNSSSKQISDEEKQRMLQEVQDQQADFGVTK